MVELYFKIISENKDSIFILQNPLYDFTFVHHITWIGWCTYVLRILGSNEGVKSNLSNG